VIFDLELEVLTKRMKQFRPNCLGFKTTFCKMLPGNILHVLNSLSCEVGQVLFGNVHGPFFFKETARETLESCCDSTKRRLERTLPSDDLEHKLTSADAKQEKMVGKCLPAF